MATYPVTGSSNWDTPLKTYIDGAAATLLGSSNGTDDTSTLNTILSGASNKLVRGTSGENYIISAPLVMKSGTTLDMTGCTVTLKAGSGCNMVNNRAWSTAQRSVSVTTTNGSTTVTATSGTFSSADNGRSIVIPGAMVASGGVVGPLCAPTFLTSTTATMSAPATAVVTATASNIYDRDTDITIIGGTWDRGNNLGTGNAAHSLSFRRLDRLKILDIRFKSTNGKYAIDLGSVNRFIVEHVSLNAASDGVHINGDCQYGYVGQIDGSTGDDFVAITSRSAPTYTIYEDVAGDVRDIVVDTLTISSSLASFKLLGGAGTVISGIKVRNIQNENTSGAGVVAVGSEDPTLYVQDIRDVLVDGLSSPALYPIACTSNITDLTIRNVKATSTTSSTYVVNVTNNTTVTNLLIDGVVMTSAVASGAIVRTQASSSTITNLKVSNVYTTPSGNTYILTITSGGTVSSATFDKVTLVGGGGFVDTQGGGTFPTLRLINCDSNGTAWLAALGTTTDLYCWGVTNASPANGVLYVTAAARVSFRGEGNNFSGTHSITAGAIVTSFSSDFPYSASAGALPTVAALAAAGTGATASIVGNDRSGTVTVTTGTGPTTGDQATVTFTAALGATVRQVLLIPTNAAASAARPYVSTKASGSWRIAAQTAPGASGAMTFDYLVVA